MKYIIISLFIIAALLINTTLAQEKSYVAFTFDDGTSKSIMNYSNENWNRMILDHLKEHNLQAVLYVCGKNLNNPDGKKILESWDNAGHIIANHTYQHVDYNNEENSFDNYKDDILRCDTLITRYKNYQRYFRAPFLKYGDTKEKRDSLNAFLKSINYKNGYVTIDASDWFYNVKLIRFMNDNPGKDIETYKKYFIEHMLERAEYYDDLAFKILGRKIKHSILLHHNLISAFFLGDLIMAFKNNNWLVINADEAFQDEVYKMVPDIIPAGESIIWGLAKETGKYEDILRYPGEDSRYEEEKLNELGL